MKKLYGVTVALTTPFTRDNKVDYGALSEIVEFLIRAGVHCLYPCGTTGEMFHLSVEERQRIAEHVVKQANGRVVVYIHVGAMREENTLLLAEHARAIGADGIGAVTPAFFGATSEEMFEYYRTLAESVPEDFPVYLYNIPQLAVNDLYLETVVRLAKACPNIVGIKYSLPDILRTDEYIHVRKNFSVMQGTDRLFLPVLVMGCDGTVSGVAGVYPEVFVAVYDAYQRGDIALAREYQFFATRYCNILRCGANMAYFKEGLRSRGLAGGYMRPPMLDLSQKESELLRNALHEADKEIPDGILLTAR